LWLVGRKTMWASAIPPMAQKRAMDGAPQCCGERAKGKGKNNRWSFDSFHA
jgi:hypothetical protein